MFTNWLTGSSSSSSGSGSGNSNSNASNNRLAAAAAATTSSAAAAAVMSTGNGIMANSVMSTPPDVILEVGPAPSSVRFVAHALVLGMHSGYLRSAIRMDEAAAAAAVAAAGTTATVGAAAAASGELLLYLGNVTAEQFAPLLTYMYTGYLDLNVDNIFAVLLATHVLHMPRALEICRSYLARSQTEGYLSGNASHPPPPPPPQLTAPKIIRPIASKATLPNFGFLPAPPPPAPPAPPQSAPAIGYVDATAELSIVENNDEEEDIEVFIDSNTPTDNELDTEDCNVSVVSSLASSSAASSLNIERLDAKRRTPTPPPPQPSTLPAPIAATAVKVAAKLRRSNSNNSTRKSHSKRGSNSSGLQIAKAPVPAVQLETAAPAATAAKFIIDVASCDGPVRFRRILNTAYGHKPDSSSSGSSSNSNNNCVELQRTQQSVSYSFHQQMARAISSQQRQQQLEENENSGDAATAASAPATTVVATPATPATVAAAAPSQRKQSQAELFVCVYCKHTFKSQYCYQKHAKRHLNPLSLDKKLAETQPLAAAVLRDNATAELQLLTTAATPTASATTTTATAAVAAAAAATGSETATLTAAALLRREVRPLDMNVQYYPCKTCGSKFPSYYFVHKHRKLCHADELETTNNNNNSSSSSSNINNNNNNSNSSSSNISKRETTAATTATAATAETAP
ncbi:E1A-binding protein p400 isoform X1 [Drosophila nasuta]|uniref:E1A-binding protein p400 isoform X1 n=1 Tax=Drosophila nasuta TaxID=42062 RepID=UPI00295F19E0|nr:E1A-binding protein p400 isoform X1 [Drosophila nasuta]